MQIDSLFGIIGLSLVILGILVILLGMTLMMRESDQGNTETRRESKGIILLGPIPIVWGYGKKGWAVAIIVGIILVLVWILFRG
ncbi:MAG: TIGR00304 family membrane protein [Candidatus Thorarchaeota archaeon]